MKHLPNIAGALLGLLFIFFSSIVLFHLVPMPPPPPPDSPVGMFMGAFAGTGYIILVKVCELVGGILVAIPKTRNIGLLFLGPIVINILAFHIFIAKDGIFSVPVLAVSVLSAYLLWAGRKEFAKLLR